MNFTKMLASPLLWIGALCGVLLVLSLFFMAGTKIAKRGGIARITPTTFAKLFGYDDDQRVAMLCPWGGPAGAWQIRVYVNDTSTGFVQYVAINFDPTEEGIANARTAFAAFTETDAFSLDVRDAHWIGNYEPSHRTFGLQPVGLATINAKAH